MTASSNDILAIHGAWRYAEPLAKWLNLPDRATVPDLYGHGVKAGLECLDGVPFRRYVEQIKGLLVRQAPSVLIGHSMGGLIAQVVANEMPGRVKGVVLMASSPPKGIKFPGNWRYYKPWYIWALLTGRAYEVGLPEQHYFFPDIPREVVFYPESGRASWEILRGIPVESLNCPVMVIAGEGDRVFPVETEHQIAQFHGGHRARAVVYPGSHTFHLDPRNREKVREAVIAFADSCLALAT